MKLVKTIKEMDLSREGSIFRTNSGRVIVKGFLNRYLMVGKDDPLEEDDLADMLPLEMVFDSKECKHEWINYQLPAGHSKIRVCSLCNTVDRT